METATTFPSSPRFHYENNISYADQWQRHKERYNRKKPANHVVFGLVWWKNEYLIACTAGGEIVLWKPAPAPAAAARPPATRRRIPSALEETGETAPDGGDDDDDDDDDPFSNGGISNKDSNRSCIFRRKVSNGKLYAMKLERGTAAANAGDRVLLVVSGDEGVLLFDWEKDFLEPLQLQLRSQDQSDQDNNKASTKTTTATPFARFRPHPSALEPNGVEVNDVLIHENCIYAAAGDAFGCYKWDLEGQRLVATYNCSSSSTTTTTTTSNRGRNNNYRGGGGGGRGGYLQSLDVTPNSSSNSSNLLLAGGDGGILHLWDCAKDCKVDGIDMTEQAASHQSTASTTTTGRSPSKKQHTGYSHYSITGIATHDENWWTVAGGINSSSSGGGDNSGSNDSCTGYLSSWHAPTRSMVAFTETRERPQQVLLQNKFEDCHETTASALHNSNATSSDRVLLSLANEPVVSFWVPQSLQRTQRVRVMDQCNNDNANDSFCSGYAASAAPDGRLAVAGVGNSVLILENGVIAARLKLT